MQHGLGFWMSVIFAIQCLTAVREITLNAKNYSQDNQEISSIANYDNNHDSGWRSMMKNKNSIRDNAEPTGKMSAEESHKYAKNYQAENFGDLSNVGDGRAGEADGMTQASVQKDKSIPDRMTNRTAISHQANNTNDHSDKDKH